MIGREVRIEDGAIIRAFSHLEGARVRGGASVGPFARLRPGADIAANAQIGNFVEIKQATIEEGAKINHLTYIGDARVGAHANIGAGTITCNYDGFDKHRTDIGAGAFIGSNSALVAPVTIGDGAYVGSGSVITRTVEAGRARGGAWPAADETRLGQGVPRQAQEGLTANIIGQRFPSGDGRRLAPPSVDAAFRSREPASNRGGGPGRSLRGNSIG